MNFTHGSLFSGIGGFDLAAEWMGWQNIFHCEWNPFCQKVLAYHFPNSKQYHDITKTDFTIHRGTIDILTGGFPCQPFSNAGEQLGTEDERHLWPEMLRAIREIQPCFVVGENVSGLVTWSKGMVFEQVQIDLEAEGYEVTPFLLPAAGIDAPHKRERVWFIAYASGKLRAKLEQRSAEQKNKKEINSGVDYRTSRFGYNGATSNSCGSELQGSIVNRSPNKEGTNESESGQLSRSICGTWQNFPTQSPICNGNDGLSGKLDGITFSKWRIESVKAGGNAIVPQVALQIFKAIEEFEKLSYL